MTAQVVLELRGIHHWFGDLHVLHDVNLRILRGEIVALVGPTGAGKTSLAHLIPGYHLATAGEVLIDGKDVTTSAASDRNLSMVFQSYALFPHLSVAENVVFGLKVRRVPKKERQEKLHRALEITGLLGYEDRKPGELSGGQRQRVALARALVVRSFLIDQGVKSRIEVGSFSGDGARVDILVPNP